MSKAQGKCTVNAAGDWDNVFGGQFRNTVPN